MEKATTIDEFLTIEIYFIRNCIQRQLEPILRTEFGITSIQFAVLDTLRQQSPLCVGDIKHRISSSDGTIPLVISNLEKMDLVYRYKNFSDKRITMVELTDKGNRLIKTAYTRHRNAVNNLFTLVSKEDKTMLFNLLKKVSHSIADKKQSTSLDLFK